MIRETKGSVLAGSEPIIAHQVNCKGVMGAGVAKQIRQQLLSAAQYGRYQKQCREQGAELLGKCELTWCPDGRLVANLYGENIPTGKGLDTDYQALRKALVSLKHKAAPIGDIAIPGYLGCGLAGGDWERVYRMLRDVFGEFHRTVTIYYLPDSVERLWQEFGDVPIDPETECLEAEWHGFPKGTHRETFWHWFEETFGCSVAEDLMHR